MTMDTCLFDTILEKIMSCKTPMSIMTVDTGDPSLLERMMTRQGELRLGRLMAFETKSAGINGGDLQIWTCMDIMTVKTGNFFDGMVSGVPVMQVEGGVG